jgi:hypothetical protein
LWRARVEATVQGDALQRFGINSLADLDGYDFERLTPLFKFRRPTDPLTQAKGNRFVWFSIITNRRIRDATPLRGIHSFSVIGRTDKRGNTRSESTHIEVEPMLTGACKDALKRLSI